MPKRTLEVDGFTLEITKNPANLAEGGAGAHLLLDGYLKVVVSNPGTNPFWPEDFQFELVIAKLVDEDLQPNIMTDVHVCLIGPNDSVSGVALVDSTFHGNSGIWLIIDVEIPETADTDTMFSHLLMLEEARMQA